MSKSEWRKLLETRKYAAVLKVAERGKFASAAKDLGYTQSALSQMIASLEAELGFKLIERQRTGSRLTPEGEALLPFLEQVANAERSLEERAAEISGLEFGVVRIGTIASISAHWLPSLMREFEESYPGVRFVIHQGDYTLIPDWINSGLIDFGFVNPRAVSGLQTRMLRTGPMSAVLPRDHRLAKLDVIPLGNLADEPFILLEEGSYYEPLEAFASCGCEPQVKYVIHDDYSIMAMVERGLGVTILADLIMKGSPYDLVTRPTDPMITRDIALAWKDTARLPVAARRFMELIESRVSELP